MKPAILLLLLAGISAANPFETPAERAERYRKTGLSLDRNIPPTPPKYYPLAEVLEDSPQFQNALAAARKRRSDFTKETLLAYLRSGKTLKVDVFQSPTSCPTCLGAGKLPDPKSTTPDRKSTCRKCQGKGKLTPHTVYTLCWVPPTAAKP